MVLHSYTLTIILKNYCQKRLLTTQKKMNPAKKRIVQHQQTQRHVRNEMLPL